MTSVTDSLANLKSLCTQFSFDDEKYNDVEKDINRTLHTARVTYLHACFFQALAATKSSPEEKREKALELIGMLGDYSVQSDDLIPSVWEEAQTVSKKKA